MEFLEIDVQKLVRRMVPCVIFFSVMGMGVDIAKFVFGHGQLWGLNGLFQLDLEMTFPAFYQMSALLFAAAMMALLSVRLRRLNRTDTRRWRFLSWTFVYIALDEILALHERTIIPLRNALKTGGVLYFSWVIYGAVFLAVFVIVCWPLFMRLPAGIRGGVLLAAALYVGGAFILEMAGGVYSERFGQETFAYNVFFADIEEILEMSGVVVLLHTLVSYWRVLGGSNIIRLKDPVASK